MLQGMQKNHSVQCGCGRNGRREVICQRNHKWRSGGWQVVEWSDSGEAEANATETLDLLLCGLGLKGGLVPQQWRLIQNEGVWAPE